MSLDSGNELPVSEYSEQYIDLSNADTAARSLRDAHKNIQGKVLFYRQGDNYFAVAEKERPKFFWRQLLCCICGDAPHYANDEVGEKLALLFDDCGKSLQAKMNTGWFKRAVDSQEFLATSTHNLSLRSTELNETITEYLSHNIVSQDVRSVCQGCLTRITLLHEKLQSNKANRETFDTLDQELASIRFDFLRTTYDAESDPNVADNGSLLLGNPADELRGRLKSHISDEQFNMIHSAGLADEKTLSVCDAWDGPLSDFAQVLVTKASKLKQRINRLAARIEKYSNLKGSMYDFKTRSNLGSYNDHAGYLHDQLREVDNFACDDDDPRLLEVDDFASYDDKMEVLKWVEKELAELTSSKKFRPSASRRLSSRAVDRLNQSLVNIRFYHKVTGHQVQPFFSQWNTAPGALFIETVKQVNGSAMSKASAQDQVKKLQDDLDVMAEKILRGPTNADGKYSIAGGYYSREQLESMRMRIFSSIDACPEIGALLSAYYHTPVTIYEYDQKTDQVKQYDYGDDSCKGTPIRLAFSGTQYHGTEFRKLPKENTLSPMQHQHPQKK